ncbi:Ferredoxin thioredoxin reductase catalytic beta chain [uncultured archaeon]|nr:Ferredoxin thioredoxin reductase catalytic beta chain [uncultured archaeon]
MKSWDEFKSKDAEEFRKDAETHAKNTGIKVNPDKSAVDTIIKGMFKNKKEKGELYCPCRIVTGDKKKDSEIICPCVFHRGEVELEGHCRCFLFVSK